MTTKKKRTKKITQAAVARDVVKQINLKKFTAESMTYCLLPIDASVGGGNLQKILENLKPTEDRLDSCRVCALGALFLSSVVKRDGFTLGFKETTVGGDTMRTALKDIFPRQDLLLIEAAFEGFLLEPKHPLMSLLPYAHEFYKIINDDERLIRIMKNIAKNGSFRPDLEVWQGEPAYRG